jgi:hypothetical protein
MTIFETHPSSHRLSQHIGTFDLIDLFLLLSQVGANTSQDWRYQYSDTIHFAPVGNSRTSYTFEYHNDQDLFLLRKMRQDIFFNSPTGRTYLKHYPRNGEPHRFRIEKGQLILN